VKLLRSLETRTIRRLGGKKEIEVDIRILAASNRDLQKALANGDMRDDLYYRLAVVELYLPPLRDRGGDIKLLANEFLSRFAKANGKKITGFTETAWEWILSYHWPGNVRELKNAVERAVIMARGDKVTDRDITPRHIRPLPELPALNISPTATVAEARRQLVLRTFASTGGDHERTAKIVGLSATEVRQELTAMVNSMSRNGAQPRASGARAAGSGRGGKAASRAPAKSSKGKNR
jgi:two-component system response regulator HydG